MTLTKSELIASLKHEVHILLHLASKIDPLKLDYRPTPKQRSTIELLQYLSVMGPELVKAAKAGQFDPAIWTVAEKAAQARATSMQTLAAIAAQRRCVPVAPRRHVRRRLPYRDRDVRQQDDARRLHRQPGAVWLCRLPDATVPYLKACGREELGTMNLWAGVDAAAPV